MAHGKYASRFHVVSWCSLRKAITGLLNRGAIIQNTYDIFYFIDFDGYLGECGQCYSCNTTTMQLTEVEVDVITGDVWKITGSYYDDDRILDLIPFDKRNQYRVKKP